MQWLHSLPLASFAFLDVYVFYSTFLRHPLLGSEFRSNSVSGGRPSVINKTSINSMGLGGLGNSNSFTGNNSRNDSNKTSNNSNRSSGNSGESGVTDR